MENLMLTGQIKGTRDREKRCTIYLASLSEWMAEQGFGEMAQKTEVKHYKRQKIVESHDCQRSEETRHIGEVVMEFGRCVVC